MASPEEVVVETAHYKAPPPPRSSSFHPALEALKIVLLVSIAGIAAATLAMSVQARNKLDTNFPGGSDYSDYATNGTKTSSSTTTTSDNAAAVRAPRGCGTEAVVGSARAAPAPALFVANSQLTPSQLTRA